MLWHLNRRLHPLNYKFTTLFSSSFPDPKSIFQLRFNSNKFSIVWFFIYGVPEFESHQRQPCLCWVPFDSSSSTQFEFTRFPSWIQSVGSSSAFFFRTGFECYSKWTSHAQPVCYRVGSSWNQLYCHEESLRWRLGCCDRQNCELFLFFFFFEYALCISISSYFAPSLWMFTFKMDFNKTINTYFWYITQVHNHMKTYQLYT